MSVIVVGSSGGGTATLGHTDPQDLLRAINCELERINSCDHDENRRSEHGILYALFISCDVSMDSINEERDIATLWTVGIGEDCAKGLSKSFQVRPYYTGFLRDVNSKVKELEESIIVPAMKEEMSLVKGMICISCDPKCTNFSSLAAAATQHLPVTGSGGTSLSAAATTHEGLSIVGNAGGSVATTTYTRAVSFSYALSTAWKEPYSPFKGGQRIGKPKIGSILDACLPSFLAVCVSCKVLDFILQTSTGGEIDSHGEDLVKTLTNYQFIQQLRYQALPSVCSVVAATSLAPEHGSTAVMAATVASISSWGSILAGLFAGWLVSFLLGRTLFMSIRLGIPATMTNILTAGFVGSGVALLFHASGVVRLLSKASIIIRTLVRTRPSLGTWNGQGYGFIFGCLFCYGSKVGWYHRIFLPIILIEMEQGEASIWGSMDECTLVLVSAGICAANVLLSRDAITRRGLKTNLFCGDFIEVAYPYMERSTIVNLSAYLASGIAGEILYSSDPTKVMSSAYLPFPISIFLAEDTFRVSLAMLSAFIVSFLGMLLSIIIVPADANKKRKND